MNTILLETEQVPGALMLSSAICWININPLDNKVIAVRIDLGI